MVLNSEKRTGVVDNIVALGNDFGKKYNIEMHYSGLPLIRTEMAVKVQSEMKLFLIAFFCAYCRYPGAFLPVVYGCARLYAGSSHGCGMVYGHHRFAGV